MQDFNYLFSNCMEVTMELSCCKYPLPDALPSQWEMNKHSMVRYLLMADSGIRGLVTDGATGRPVENTKVEIVGREKAVYTTDRGEYWRLLPDGGAYQIRAVAD